MESVSLRQAIKNVGGRKFFPSNFTELYLYAGINSIEKYIEQNMTKSQKCGIITGKNGIIMASAVMGKPAYLGIPYSDIVKIYYIGGADKEIDHTDNIAKAATGAFFLGPTGLLAGVLNEALNSNRILCCIQTKTDSIIVGTFDYMKPKLDKFFIKICPSVFNPDIF